MGEMTSANANSKPDAPEIDAANRIDVDLSRSKAAELGATLVTLVAYPEVLAAPRLVRLFIDSEARSCRLLSFPGLDPILREAVETRIAVCVAATFATVRDPWSVEPLTPAYAFHDEAWVNEGLKRLYARWEDCLRVGRLFALLADAAEKGAAYVPPAGVTRPSIDQLVTVALPNATEYERNNFLARVWRRSRPIAHFAAAINVFEAMALVHWGRPGMLLDLIVRPALLDAVLWRAEDFASIVSASGPKTARYAEGLIRLRPIGQWLQKSRAA